MTGWDLLPRIVLVLSVAAAMGMLMQRLRQSVVVGYLLAGILLGPTFLGAIHSTEEVRILSELGVALLLFAIGLEFSLQRLREFGATAAGGGLIQILVTIGVAALAARLTGSTWAAAAVIGMAFAMSSTAVVIRVLTDRAGLDSMPGRTAVGILLVQDIAVIPILITTDILASPKAGGGIVMDLLTRATAVLVFIVLAWAAARYVLPQALGRALRTSRDLPVVIAVCTSIGAAWGAHAMGFSPSLGAFTAGLVLAESPFATQIRADVTPLSAVFITLFFSSVGTAVDLPLNPVYLATLAVAAVVCMVAKSFIAGAAVWLFRRSLRTALIAGVFVGQVGEFTFVITDQAYRGGLLSPETFQFTLGLSLLTLLLTPWAISAAPGAATRLLRTIPAASRPGLQGRQERKDWKRVIVVGYGPAGQRVVEQLRAAGLPLLVLEMNPNTVAAYRPNVPMELGDATQPEVLQHVGAGQCLAIVVTIPDPAAAQLITGTAQNVAPGVPIVVRSRYHQYSQALIAAGADHLVDEEEMVGEHLAGEALRAARR